MVFNGMARAEGVPIALLCPNKTCQIFGRNYYSAMTKHRFIWILTLACWPACVFQLSAQTNVVDPKIIEKVKARAEKGEAEAQDELGYYYARGIVGKDYAEAAKWYRKAAEQGHAPAQFHLGDFYTKGKGVTGDPVEAAKWYRKAADQGHSSGQSLLGSCYATGRGVSKDLVEAHKWLSLASAQGDLSAKGALPALESEMTGEQIATAKERARGFKPVKTP